MKEIKFRWEAKSWKLVYWYYVYSSVFSNTNDYYKHLIITEKWDINEIEIETLWQYTWLKNNDWKEIFEGDIVKYEWKYVWVIEFYFCSYIINWLEVWNCIPTYQNLWWYSDIEIIWNVFENPELLEFPKELKPKTKYYNFNNKEYYKLNLEWKIYKCN